MVYSLAYRRPPHVSSSRASLNGAEKPASVGESFRSGSTACPIGIPDALSFDRVISGGTCPPCTTRDFMNYLIYIEHSAENLQFFLWYQDYVKRFSALPASERALSLEWTIEKADADASAAANTAATKNAAAKTMSPETAAIFEGTEFARVQTAVQEFKRNTNPFHTPPKTPEESRSRGRASDGQWDDYASTLKSSQKSDYIHKAAGAFEEADVKYHPFTIQPFREEVTRIIASYISEEGSRQLNLAAKERTALLRALAITTHPSAFRTVLHTAEWTLRHQSHPNFIRWTICNGNRPRVVFARGLGVGGIVAGFITAFLITLSGAGRGWRALSAVLFMIGIATLIAAWKGMCVVLHGMHHRHLRPWELFAQEDDAASEYELKKGSLDAFGASNSYEDEPWIAQYDHRNVIRKVFDREVWIQEPALRQIQDTIFVQALLGAVLGSAILVVIFVVVPKGNFY